MEYSLLVSYLINVSFYHTHFFFFFLKNISVKPKDYAIIFDAIPSKVVSLLRNSEYSSVNVDQQHPICSDTIFIGDIHIVKDKCSNKYIRNI